MPPTPVRRVEIYDTTLRDGTQGEGVAFSLVDKLNIAQRLDALGVDYIEGGYPLSNPKDVAFFAEVRKLHFRHAQVCAFGMTRRKGTRPADDPGMIALIESGAPVITIVGKTWDLHVDEVLQVTRQENLDMIGESVEFCRRAGAEVFYDAEHFFDGCRSNRDYALETLRAALAGGATRLVLCDTNGGSLPAFVAQAVRELVPTLTPASDPSSTLHAPSGGRSTPHAFRGLGIHTHNDGGLAVANSLAAVEAGCIQVQGTINGIGERCGNVDLLAVAANLRLKLGCDCLQPDSLAKLTETSRYVYEVANMNLVANQPFVGPSAFAHKGGMHVHGVQRVAHSYEHVPPERVGNSRRVLISELSGASNIAATLGRKFAIEGNRALQRQVLQKVQDLEHQGYQFEAATASFELLLHELLGTRPAYWAIDRYRCVIFKAGAEAPTTEATVKLTVGGAGEHSVAEGDGPINALDGALRKCLAAHYPQLAQVHLRDYKVRVVNATAESAAKVRVTIEFAVRPAETRTAEITGSATAGAARDAGRTAAAGPEGEPLNGGAGHYFTTIGVSENIVDASLQALTDAFAYHLIEGKVAAK